MFGNRKREWLGTFLELEYGIPDTYTFRNVIKEIDTQKLHILFCEWIKSVVSDISGVIAIDEKTARRTRDRSKRPLHVVSAFLHECGLVMGQVACDEKSNEITAIPQLLEMFEIKGCTVTIDSMGTQKNIVEKIVSKNTDYILSLKENQKSIYKDVKLYLDDIYNYAKSIDKGHGRIKMRTCVISEEKGKLSKLY